MDPDAPITHPNEYDPDLLYLHASQCLQDSITWFGSQDRKLGDTVNIPHMTLSLCGEVGELANMVKKVQRGSLDWHDPEVQDDIRMEIADVYIYLMNLVALTSTDLKAAYERKRAYNEERFNGVGAG